MTTRAEDQRAVDAARKERQAIDAAREFLDCLADPQKSVVTGGVRRMRERAAQILRHYPGQERTAQLFSNAEFGAQEAVPAIAESPKVRLEGYQEVLPIKGGDTVVIRKGTPVKTVGKEERPAGRTYRVKVHHTLSGINHPNGEPYQNPKVVWAGPGGYWTQADINDVTKIEADEREKTVEGD